MLPGCLTMPLSLVGAAFWIFGPSWSWVPFTLIFVLLLVPTLAAGPKRIAAAAPTAAQSMSATFSLTLVLAIAVAIGLLIRGRYLELPLCILVFVASGLLWPRLRTLGPM